MRNVILPAVLVSSGVFSVLTFPFVLNNTEVVEFVPPQFLEDSSQPFFNRENKSAAIRYVGGAIVVSVGAGVATIEILRRMHPANQLSKFQKDALNSQIRQLEAEGQSDPLLLTENVETAIADFLNSQESVGSSEQKISFTSSGLPNFEPESSIDQFSWEESAPTQQALSSILESGWISSESLQVDSENITSQNLIPIAVSTSHQSFELIGSANAVPGQMSLPYETYRIRVPHRQDTLFAILLEGEYYSLVRTHKSQEKVLELATRLYQLGDRVVITSVGERYAVWALQPEAYLEWVS
jgi:hypothetical protein